MRRLQLLHCLLFLVSAAPIALADDAASTQPAPGSIFEREALEPPPPSLILDKARLLNPDEHSALSARLMAFGEKNKILIYVVAYSVLIGETIDERTSRLKDHWLKEDHGVVLAYERGSERISFASTSDPIKYITGPQLEKLFANAYKHAAQQKRGATRVMAAADRVMLKLPSLVQGQRDSNSATASETRSFIGWALAGLVLLTIAGMFVFYHLRRTQVEMARSYKFPPLKTAERYGGPYSGGHQAEIHFTDQSA